MAMVGYFYSVPSAVPATHVPRWEREATSHSFTCSEHVSCAPVIWKALSSFTDRQAAMVPALTELPVTEEGAGIK